MSELTSSDIEELEEMSAHYPLVKDVVDTFKAQRLTIQQQAEEIARWKAEAQWAARRVGVALITKDDHQRAQRILEEA